MITEPSVRGVLMTGNSVLGLTTCAKCGERVYIKACPHCGSIERRKTKTRRGIADKVFERLAKYRPEHYDPEALAAAEQPAGDVLAYEWEHYVQADDSTLTKDAQELAAFLRKLPPHAVGDHLYVRETMRVIEIEAVCTGVREGSYDPRSETNIRVRYEAAGQESGWLPYPDRLKGIPVVGKCLAYGGYKEAARIWLEVTDVRAEQLLSISEEDALAEGIFGNDGWWRYGNNVLRPRFYYTAREAYFALWDIIHGEGAAAENPWVWANEFKPLTGRKK